MLEGFNNTLVETFGPLGPLFAIGLLGVLLVLMTLPTLLKKRVDPMERIQREQAAAREMTAEKKRGLRHHDAAGEKLDKFKQFLEPQNEEEYSATKLKLLRAGYRGRNAVRTFHFIQFSLGLGLLFFGIILALIKSANGDSSTQSMVLTVLIPGVVGYYIPRYWVQKRLDKRAEEIVNGFPDALDMMLVCVEAGQSLDQAIVRVAHEIKAGYPALAEEFETVAAELKAGKERVTVLRDMAERAGVPDISSFVTVMIQSATFGTSIAEALRVYGAEMRDKRVMRAEEKANVLPTKLTLGTMLFTVPPLLLILVGPSMYGMYITLTQTGTGL